MLYAIQPKKRTAFYVLCFNVTGNYILSIILGRNVYIQVRHTFEGGYLMDSINGLEQYVLGIVLLIIKLKVKKDRVVECVV